MNLPAWQERWAEPAIAALGRALPGVPLPPLSRLYGESLHEDYGGSWSYELDWKPLEGFTTRAGWFRAIHRAQKEIERGIDIRCPVLMLHAERSLRPTSWTDEVRTADIVLDVDDMRRLAPRLGPRVEIYAVPGAIHDIMLSDPPARARAFDLVASWLTQLGW